jgi:UDP-N-acetylmuramate: L-alanyl-gamma-D-glutamyl-meso-diaminopimelate ligase
MVQRRKKTIHVLGISGTFMAGLAVIAKQLGYAVSGHDNACYSPMKEQLATQGISVTIGYDGTLPVADLYIIGNSISRGNPFLETILVQGLSYCSGPEWLYREVLVDKWVMAIAGTHGKTTTTSMLAWIMERAGHNPSFLIGGIAENFGCSARLTDSDMFIIEADEYDTAYFDKRPKFMHYRPKTLVVNNLEFDHADIYTDLESIKQQFHYLIRTVPADGSVIYAEEDANIREVLTRGCWSKRQGFGERAKTTGWYFADEASYQTFDIGYAGKSIAHVDWGLRGVHNASNATAAVAAANHCGVSAQEAATALHRFKGVKRRLEHKGTFAGVVCYDDFGHHPTAIAKVLSSLRHPLAKHAKIISMVELGSYTIRSGVMADRLYDALLLSDRVVLLNPGAQSSFDWRAWAADKPHIVVVDTDDAVCEAVVEHVTAGDVVISFSSRNFHAIHATLKRRLLQTSEQVN